MLSWLSSALEWLTPYITSTLSILVFIYLLLKTNIGSRVFDSTFKHYFDKKLLELKYEQDRRLADLKLNNDHSIEELRSELSQVTDRGIRSNDKKYQALIASWEGFIDAYYQTLSCIGRLSFRPDLSSLGHDELDDYLEIRIQDSAGRRFIRSASDKNKAFDRVEQAIVQNKAQSAIWDARTIVRKQSVFIPKEIEERFETALSTLNKAWVEQHINYSSQRQISETVSIELVGTSGEELKNGLRDLVRFRVNNVAHAN